MGRVSYTTKASQMPADPRLRVHESMTRPVPRLGSVQAANEANIAHARLQAGEADRQEKKHILGVVNAVKKILKQKDKRRRPRGVSKEDWKLARKMRLTRTKRPKHKQKPRP